MRLALLALALLLAPAALADHAYSHRFVVEGRLVGANGLPVAGVAVTLNATGERLAEPCREGHQSVTDAYGDFAFCYHRHEMTSEGIVRVAAGNATATRPVDWELRRMVFLLRDRSANGTAPPDWATRFRVDGRVWERGAATVEGVRVEGVAFERERVEVTLERPGGAGNRFHVETDGFGGYLARFNLLDEEFPEDVALNVTARGATLRVPLDPTWHRMTVDFRLPLEEQGMPRMPGTRSGPVTMPLVLAVALGGVLAVALARRGKT